MVDRAAAIAEIAFYTLGPGRVTPLYQACGASIVHCYGKIIMLKSCVVKRSEKGRAYCGDCFHFDKHRGREI